MHDPGLLSAWAVGRTGIPFVDACMRELAATGWMSNRGRQNAASLLAKELRLDWRLGAELFECLLLDGDAAVNWANWAYFAGAWCERVWLTSGGARCTAVRCQGATASNHLMHAPAPRTPLSLAHARASCTTAAHGQASATTRATGASRRSRRARGEHSPEHGFCNNSLMPSLT